MHPLRCLRSALDPMDAAWTLVATRHAWSRCVEIRNETSESNRHGRSHAEGNGARGVPRPRQERMESGLRTKARRSLQRNHDRLRRGSRKESDSRPLPIRELFRDPTFHSSMKTVATKGRGMGTMSSTPRPTLSVLLLLVPIHSSTLSLLIRVPIHSSSLSLYLSYCFWS